MWKHRRLPAEQSVVKASTCHRQPQERGPCQEGAWGHVHCVGRVQSVCHWGPLHPVSTTSSSCLSSSCQKPREWGARQLYALRPAFPQGSSQLPSHRTQGPEHTQQREQKCVTPVATTATCVAAPLSPSPPHDLLSLPKPALSRGLKEAMPPGQEPQARGSQQTSGWAWVSLQPERGPTRAEQCLASTGDPQAGPSLPVQTGATAHRAGAVLTGTGKPSYSRRSCGSGKTACQQFR